MDSQNCYSIRGAEFEAYQCVLEAIHQIQDPSVEQSFLSSLNENWCARSQRTVENESSPVQLSESQSPRPVSLQHSLVLTECALTNLGIDVIYPCVKMMPLDLDLVRDELARVLPNVGANDSVNSKDMDGRELLLEIEELAYSGGIINRIFFVSLPGDSDSPQPRISRRYVLKVLPPYAHWKKRKCENEVFAMNLARAHLPSGNEKVSNDPLPVVIGEASKLMPMSSKEENEISVLLVPSVLMIPTIVHYVSDRSQSLFLREYILMSYHEGIPLESIPSPDPIRIEAQRYLKQLDDIFRGIRFARVGNFTWDEARQEVVVGPEIEHQRDSDASDLRTWMWRKFRFGVEIARKWLYRKRRSDVESSVIVLEDEKIENDMEDEKLESEQQANDFSRKPLEEMSRLVIESYEALEPSIERIMTNLLDGTISDSEFAFGDICFDHCDLNDGNILIQLSEGDGNGMKRVERMIILDFEWATAQVLDYPGNSLFARLNALCWTLYLVHCSMRDYRRTRRKLLCVQKKYIDDATEKAVEILNSLK
jgi:hypothetical protein